MSDIIQIQWIGYRKDGDRGSVWGWFVRSESPIVPAWPWTLSENGPNMCYIFRGRIGKILHIEERILDGEFLVEVATKQKNFKGQDPDKIMAKWGKSFKDELSMFIMMIRLRDA